MPASESLPRSEERGSSEEQDHQSGEPPSGDIRTAVDVMDSHVMDDSGAMDNDVTNGRPRPDTATVVDHSVTSVIRS